MHKVSSLTYSFPCFKLLLQSISLTFNPVCQSLALLLLLPLQDTDLTEVLLPEG